MSDLNELSAAEAAKRLARREITAEALLRDCLARIDAREAQVRAWRFVARDEALAQARALDRGAVRGPLHGLPVGVKDIFDTHDMPTEYGSPIYAGHRPTADAAVVALTRRAGGVVLGKTVTTEFATFHRARPAIRTISCTRRADRRAARPRRSPISWSRSPSARRRPDR